MEVELSIASCMKSSSFRVIQGYIQILPLHSGESTETKFHFILYILSTVPCAAFACGLLNKEQQSEKVVMPRSVWSRKSEGAYFGNIPV
jgi:hypothetical protein